MNRIPEPLVMLSLLLLAACAAPPAAIVHQPMSVLPRASVPESAANGSIFSAGIYRPFFEDRRARHVGDILTVQLNEKTAANKNSASSADRTGSSAFGVRALKGLPGKSFLGSELDASSASSFEGKGSATASNDFTGTITVTVIEVFPNGNLLVSGEKQIGMTQGTEFLRFSGIVSPATVTASNMVLSTHVADARLEYKANGYIDSAQVMGWLARFFLNVLPF